MGKRWQQTILAVRTAAVAAPMPAMESRWLESAGPGISLCHRVLVGVSGRSALCAELADQQLDQVRGGGAGETSDGDRGGGLDFVGFVVGEVRDARQR